MPNETEIKLRIRDKKAFLRALRKMGTKVRAGQPARVHEANTIFDTPDGGLAKHGQLLRIRTETPVAGRQNKGKKPKQRVVLTFKSPAAGAVTPGKYKVRDEIEMEIADAATLGKIFLGLGLKGWFRYEKFRTTHLLPASARWAKGLLIELDETPIGTFVELEGPPEAIDRAAALLGFSRRDYILANYLMLHIAECRRRGIEPGDMLFPARH